MDALALQKTFGCTILSTFGLTECSPICSPSLPWQLEVQNTVGPAISASIKIADHQGHPIPYGEIGEIFVKGPGVTPGYEEADNSPSDENKDTFIDGWLRTGDLGTMATSGFVFHKGRKKEVLKRGGKQISLHEVDEAIRNCHGVDICLSFGVPNDFWGEEVACAVVLKSGAENTNVDQIIQEARKRLDDYKVPRQILLVDHSKWPKSKTGKYKRHLMAAALNVQAVDLSVPLSLKSAPQNAIQARPAHSRLRQVLTSIPDDQQDKYIEEQLTETIGKMLQLGGTAVDPDCPLERYGLDSLRRVELRNWLWEEFQIEPPIDQLHGGICMMELAQLVSRAISGAAPENSDYQATSHVAHRSNPRAESVSKSSRKAQHALIIKLRNLVYLSHDDQLNFFERLLKQAIRRATGIASVENMIYDYCTNRNPDETIHHACLRRLKLKLNFNQSGINNIPSTGPAVIIANHPFGLIETAIVRYLVSLRRPDLKNFSASFGDINRFPERAEHMLPLDFQSILTGDLTEKDVKSMNLAISHVKQGGALIIFPAGFISVSDNLLGGKVEDREWKLFAAKVIKECQATVVPIYFAGQNSRLFNMISRWNATSIMGLFFFREQLSKIGSSVNFQIGSSISYEQLKLFPDYGSLTLHLRAVTYQLKENIK
ncbi:MAG: AMP-binding protein [Phormidesmis sp. RL_2_1]|nr:AMP-binding protein [Phormidesmis sp. RL_2_1]